MPRAGLVVLQTWRVVPKPACAALSRALTVVKGPRTRYLLRLVPLGNGTFIELLRHDLQGGEPVTTHLPWAYSNRETAIAAAAIAKHLKTEVCEVDATTRVVNWWLWSASGNIIADSEDTAYAAGRPKADPNTLGLERLKSALPRAHQQELPKSPKGAAEYAARERRRVGEFAARLALQKERSQQRDALKALGRRLFEALWPIEPGDWWSEYYGTLRREGFPRYCVEQAPQLTTEIEAAHAISPEAEQELRELAQRWPMGGLNRPKIMDVLKFSEEYGASGSTPSGESPR